MVTINQLIHQRPRRPKKKKMKKTALKYHWNSLHKKYILVNKPQISGVIKDGGIKVLHPRKPNSGNRKNARVVLTNKKTITVYIPGERHTLQSFGSVLIQGGGAKDVPGVGFSIIRGTRDTQGVQNRQQGRSLYGTKRPKK